MRRLLLLVSVATALFAARADAQFFRNGGISGSVGWHGMGSTWDAASGAPLWNINDQVTFGARGFAALGYNLWFEAGGGIGLSSVRISESDNGEWIFSGMFTSGLRYNFLEERFRPFVSGHINYLTLFPAPAAGTIPLNNWFGGSANWGGFSAGGGFEYIFADEQSVLLEAQMIGYLGANTAVAGGSRTFALPASSARLAYQVYF
jgi:hypothetical protein